MANLEMLDEQISVGDVKTITYTSGKNVKFIELLFSPTTKVMFAPSADKSNLEMTVSSNLMNIPELDCKITKRTLYDLIMSLKNVYSELNDESEETK